MHFNLKVKAEKDILKFNYESALVKFFIDGDNLEKLVDDFFASFSFPQNLTQKKFFLDKKNSELTYYSSFGEPSVVFLKKIKVDKSFTADFFRDYMAGLVQTLKGKQIKTIHLVVPAFSHFPGHFNSDEYLIQTIVEGIHLGNYSFDKYKSEKKNTEDLQFVLHYSNKTLVQNIIDKTNHIMSAVHFTRDLVNEPAITLTPQEFGKRTKAELSKLGVKVTVMNKMELQKRKMNAILAVGGASEHHPLMIVLEYKPKISKKKIALVGKGVTYDSGGLSIKPTQSMLEMSADMAGGGTVVGVIKAAALLKMPVEIIGIVPCVENMVNGSSYKPGDVIVSASGKTIEVKDTDAEGRIILADALHFASKQKPDEIIDFATLTGAIAVALGVIMAGLFTKNDDLANRLYESGNKTFERLWRMPFSDDYKSMIKSEIADVSNLGPRWGGAITAGKFLEHFIDEKINWAHIDLAGPALKHDFNNYTKNWDTGFGVRLMLDYLENI
ncbi:MAG: aminopeptidase A/I [Ignavibacteria bacterium]|nr:MAG: aminopeptidase A/I [Ignavibacteria bacterium]KAF0161136.1 MAG: aminopeptidase A/I [Ignavibacteria bacterium]